MTKESTDPRRYEFFETLAYIDLELEQLQRARKEFVSTQKEQIDKLKARKAAILDRLESGQMEIGDAE